MKKLAYFVTAFGMLGCAGAQAADFQLPGHLSGTVSMVSDYRFRGITQNDEHPALQASVDYAHDSGFYAGIWGSNVDFNDGDEASVEFDFSAGWSGEVKGIGWKLGAIYFAYPGADSSLNYDFVELGGSLSHDYGPFAVTAGINYSPNNFADSGDATYISLGAQAPLPGDFTLKASTGYQFIDDEVAAGVSDYADWSLGVGYKLAGFDLSLSYVDTTLNGDCAGGCDSAVIFGVSHTFP